MHNENIAKNATNAKSPKFNQCHAKSWTLLTIMFVDFGIYAQVL